MEKSFQLIGLGCANCAAKMEAAIRKLDGVEMAELNFMSRTLTLNAETDQFPHILEQAAHICKQIEPDCILQIDDHHHEHKHDRNCNCGHNHDCCGHDHSRNHSHSHDHRNNSSHMIIRIAVSTVLLIAAALLPFDGWLRAITFLIPYAVIGWDVLWNAIRNIAHGQVFNENFLMSIATAGAFAIGEYPEAVFVMLFYQVGELFQHYAVNKSRKSISSLMDIRPDYANLDRNGSVEPVDPDEVVIGDIIVVKPGERIPLDGVVLEGSSAVDTAALTGEPLPRNVTVGDEVISGCINQSGLLRIRVTRHFRESTVSKILDLVENAGSRKAKAENFITKFAGYYTPAVVIGAVLLAMIPPLFVGNWDQWFRQALVFLVVSCPCALVISVPMSFFGGIGGASKAGILVKGGNYLEVLAKTEVVVFDKTGTLTRGEFRVTSIHPEHCSKQELLELAALAESWSDHPISRSIREAWTGKLDVSRTSDAQELSGRGVQVTVDGQTVCAGNNKLMCKLGVPFPTVSETGTVVHVARNGQYLGYLIVSDELKPDADKAISALKSAGVRKTVMLTGDAKNVGEAVAARLGLDEVHTQLLPSDKVDQVELLLKNTSPNGALAFVGDGINDAPVLARADVGIAMGALGSDAAIEAADVVLMDDKPSKIADAIFIARRTLRIVKQNIIFALAVKAIVLILGAIGVVSMWLAVFADVGVAVIAILNAMRALNTKR